MRFTSRAGSTPVSGTTLFYRFPVRAFVFPFALVSLFAFRISLYRGVEQLGSSSGEQAERVLRTIQRGERVAAVEKIE